VYGAKVLVTVLFSRTLPLIRYEMSDSMQLAAEHGCRCRRPYALLSGIQGRAQEALRFPTGNGGVRMVQPIVFHHVMDAVTAAGWQIIQRPDGLEVLLVQPHEVDQSALVTSLQAALTAQGAVATTVRIREVAAIPRTALGKAPLITNADT
jgi:phenylacetate-coenzyme A ligase PaaK-like adenylate-forming protein